MVRARVNAQADNWLPAVEVVSGRFKGVLLEGDCTRDLYMPVEDGEGSGSFVLLNLNRSKVFSGSSRDMQRYKPYPPGAVLTMEQDDAPLGSA